MNLFYPAFGAVAVLVLLTTILAVQNLLRAGTLARCVSALEDEVEKRAREFDSLQKKTSQSPTRPSTALPEDNGHAAFCSGSSGGDSATAQFEVVRNIRAGYEAAGESHLEQQVVDVCPTHDESSASTTIQPPSAPSGIPTGTPRGRSIHLYSPDCRRADFHHAWERLKTILSSHESLDSLVFDCSGLENLEEGEIGYLERFVQLTDQSRIRSAIVGCAPNLASVLRSRPTLARIVEL